MAKRQVPKNGFRRYRHTTTRKLQNELSDAWRASLCERAKLLPVPDVVVEDSLTLQARNKYLDTYGSSSPPIAKELGFRSIELAAENRAFTHFVPDVETAPLQDVLDVTYGINLAKLALKTLSD